MVIFASGTSSEMAMAGVVAMGLADRKSLLEATGMDLRLKAAAVEFIVAPISWKRFCIRIADFVRLGTRSVPPNVTDGGSKQRVINIVQQRVINMDHGSPPAQL